VKQTKEGGYVIAGTTSSYGAGGTDAWLLYVLDGASTTTPATASNKSTPGFDIITTTVGLLAAICMLDKLKKFR
jgi:hypothetical protein